MPYNWTAPDDPRLTGTIADLIQRQGQIQAEGALAKGQAWSGAAQGIAKSVQGGLNSILDLPYEQARTNLVKAQAAAAAKVGSFGDALKGAITGTPMVPFAGFAAPDAIATGTEGDE